MAPTFGDVKDCAADCEHDRLGCLAAVELCQLLQRQPLLGDDLSEKASNLVKGHTVALCRPLSQTRPVTAASPSTDAAV
jgi:hypothetical protein